MGQGAEVWERIAGMYAAADVSDIPQLYAVDSIFLEPYNPPHRGNLLIQAYLKDYFGGKDDISIETRLVIESEDGKALAVEWTLSYTAAGRRWNDLPRASFITFADDGRIAYHRDYT